MGKIQWFLFVNLWGQVITLRGQILVSRKLAIRDDTQHPVEMQNKCQKTRVPVCPLKHVPMCTFKTSHCVPAPCAHVSTRVRVVPVYTGTF